MLPLQMLSEKNVRFYMNDNVTEIRGINGKVKEKNKIAQWGICCLLNLVFWERKKKTVSYFCLFIFPFSSRWRRLCSKVLKSSQQMFWLLVLVSEIIYMFTIWLFPQQYYHSSVKLKKKKKNVETRLKISKDMLNKKNNAHNFKVWFKLTA